MATSIWSHPFVCQMGNLKPREVERGPESWGPGPHLHPPSFHSALRACFPSSFGLDVLRLRYKNGDRGHFYPLPSWATVTFHMPTNLNVNRHWNKEIQQIDGIKQIRVRTTDRSPVRSSSSGFLNLGLLTFGVRGCPNIL